MRRVFLAGSLSALLAALVFLWNHRFERIPGLPVWSMADFRAGLPEVPGTGWAGTADDPVLRLKVDSQTPQVALRLAVPGVPAIEMLHLRYRMVASGLAPGEEKWEVGRMMVEWHPEKVPGEVEQDLVGNIKLNEKSGNVILISVPENGPARPAALRLEHLGSAGILEIADLELTAVRERELWKTGRWFLACGWFVWFAACMVPCAGTARWRVLAAAGIWLLMGIHFVVPGPWKIQKPLVTAFELGGLPSSQAPPLVASKPDLPLSNGAVAPSGKITPRGGLPLRIKMLLAYARPLLHILLLIGPVLASALLVGRKSTLFMAIPLSLAIEGAQAAFGYGFDWIDIIDLITDGAGIAMGLWLAGRIISWTSVASRLCRRP